MNKLIRQIILSFFLFITLAAGAQQTDYRLPPDAIMNKARMLYDDHNYGSAAPLFEQVMKLSAPTGGLVYEEASYYRLSCAHKLDQKDALPLALQFITDFPESARIGQARFILGQMFFDQRDYSECLDVLSKCSPAQLPREDRTPYYYMTGYSLMKANQYDKALAQFSKVREERSEYGRASGYYYAHLQYLKGNNEEALEAFKSIANDRKFKKYVPGYLINIYYNLGRYQEAIDEGKPYLRTADRSQQGALALVMANAAYNLGQYDMAMEYFTTAYQQSRRDFTPVESYRMGYCLFREGHYGEALPHFQDATKSEGEMEQSAWYHLGFCYLKTDEQAFAKNAFLKAYHLDPSTELGGESLFSYLKVTITTGGDVMNDPVALVEEYLTTNPGPQQTREAWALLSQLYLNSRNFNAAIKSIEKTDHPDKALQKAYQQLTYDRGVELLNRGSWQDALEYMEKSQTWPVDPQLMAYSMLWQGDALYRLKQYGPAARQYQAFLQLPEGRRDALAPTARYNLAYCAFNRDDYPQAINDFNSFLKTGAGSEAQRADAMLRLADSYFITKKYNDASRWYTKVADSKSANADYALYQLAACHGSEGHFKEKTGSLTSLIDRYPRSTYYADALYELGSTYLVMNQQRSAIVFFDRLVKERPKTAMAKKALVKMGFVYYKNNQMAEAERVLKQVIETYPASDEAREALNTLQSLYMDQGKVDQYLAYARTLDFVMVSTGVEDSLTFTAGENYYIEGNYAKANQALEQYLEKFPHGGMVLTAYGYLIDGYGHTGDTDKAYVLQEKVLLLPDNRLTEDALLVTARKAYGEGDYGKAQQRYGKLTEMGELTPYLLEALDGSMQSAWHNGDMKTASASAKQLLSQPDTDMGQQAQAWLILGRIDMDNNRMTEALTDFDEVIARSADVKGAEASYYRALLHYRSNQLETAENEVYTLAEQYPDYEYWIARAFILLADVYVGKDNIFQAEQTLQSVIDNYPGDDLKAEARGKLERLREYNNQQEAQDHDQQQ